MGRIILCLMGVCTFACQNPSPQCSPYEPLWGLAGPAHLAEACSRKAQHSLLSVSFLFRCWPESEYVFSDILGVLTFALKPPFLPSMWLPKVHAGLNSIAFFLSTSFLHLQAAAEIYSLPAPGILLLNTKIALELKNKIALGFTMTYEILDNEA